MTPKSDKQRANQPHLIVQNDKVRNEASWWVLEACTPQGREVLRLYGKDAIFEGRGASQKANSSLPGAIGRHGTHLVRKGLAVNLGLFTYCDGAAKENATRYTRFKLTEAGELLWKAWKNITHLRMLCQQKK